MTTAPAAAPATEAEALDLLDVQDELGNCVNLIDALDMALEKLVAEECDPLMALSRVIGVKLEAAVAAIEGFRQAVPAPVMPGAAWRSLRRRCDVLTAAKSAVDQEQGSATLADETWRTGTAFENLMTDVINTPARNVAELAFKLGIVGPYFSGEGFAFYKSLADDVGEMLVQS